MSEEPPPKTGVASTGRPTSSMFASQAFASRVGGERGVGVFGLAVGPGASGGDGPRPRSMRARSSPGLQAPEGRLPGRVAAPGPNFPTGLSIDRNGHSSEHLISITIAI
jgi:hypothetical protein